MARDRTRAERLRSPLLVAGLIGVLTIALHVRDPHDHGSWGFCPLRETVGWWCPFCGGLRAVNDLTNLQVGAAASSNVLFVASLPFVVALWARWVAVRWVGEAAVMRVPRWLGPVGLAVLTAFTLARNVPGSWLAP